MCKVRGTQQRRGDRRGPLLSRMEPSLNYVRWEMASLGAPIRRDRVVIIYKMAWRVLTSEVTGSSDSSPQHSAEGRKWGFLGRQNAGE